MEREDQHPLFFIYKDMKAKDRLFHLLILVAVCFWGMSFVFTTGIFNLCAMSPVSLVFFRLMIATPLLALACLIFFPQPLRAVPRREWLNLLALGFFEPFLYFIFETYSLQVTADATIVSVIIATIPILTLLLSWFYFKESLSAVNIVGVVLSVVGVVVMLLPSFTAADANLLGIALAFGAVFTAVGYSFFLKKLSGSYNPIFIVACQNAVGLVLLLPLMLLMHSPQELAAQFQYLSNSTVLLYVVLLAVLCSTLAYTIYVKGMQVIGLARANTFTNLIPVFTGIFAYFFIGEAFPPLKVVGAVVAIAGVWAAQWKSGTSSPTEKY